MKFLETFQNCLYVHLYSLYIVSLLAYKHTK